MKLGEWKRREIAGQVFEVRFVKEGEWRWRKGNRTGSLTRDRYGGRWEFQNPKGPFVRYRYLFKDSAWRALAVAFGCESNVTFGYEPSEEAE